MCAAITGTFTSGSIRSSQFSALCELQQRSAEALHQSDIPRFRKDPNEGHLHKWRSALSMFHFFFFFHPKRQTSLCPLFESSTRAPGSRLNECQRESRDPLSTSTFLLQRCPQARSSCVRPSPRNALLPVSRTHFITGYFYHVNLFSKSEQWQMTGKTPE